MIITDSISSKVNVNHIKDNINSTKEAAIFKRFPGHTAEEIAFYAPKPLEDCKPDQVVVIAGTNDLSKAFYEKGTIDEYEVVESVMKIARAAQEKGAKKVHVSSIVVRRGNQYRDVIPRVNDLLYMTCLAENFIFMDQDAITPVHISSDGVHLNFYGATLLKMKILSVFDTFDPNVIDFNFDYEKALY